MTQAHQVGTDSRFLPIGPSLPERIAEAVRCRRTPLSQLLRLMAALDAEGEDVEALRLQLRARIGAPLDA